MEDQDMLHVKIIACLKIVVAVLLLIPASELILRKSGSPTASEWSLLSWAMLLAVPAYLVSGIFILQFKEWARMLSVAIDCILLLNSGAGVVTDLLNTAGFLVTSNTDKAQAGPNVSHFLSVGAMSLVMGIIPLIMFAYFIYSLTRPKVREQFS